MSQKENAFLYQESLPGNRTRLVDPGFTIQVEAPLIRSLSPEAPIIEGYPPHKDRIRLNPAEIQQWVENGMYSRELHKLFPQSFVMNHRNHLKGIGKGFARLDDGNQLFYGVPFRDSLTEDGYITDARGIPMHPHFRTLLQYGAVGGFGFYYDYGPNPSADAIIFARKGNIMYLPLIQKRVGGKYLVPGGMIKKDEDPIEAALRECYEETGLQVNNPKIILTVYNGLHASTPRKTLHAWEESAVRLFIPDDMEITNKSLQPADDAATAQWVPIHEAVTILSTSHRAYVKQAILLFEKTQNVTITSLGTIAER